MKIKTFENFLNESSSSLRPLSSSSVEQAYDKWIGDAAVMQNEDDPTYIRRVKAKGYYDWEDFADSCFTELYTDGKDLFVKVNTQNSDSKWATKQWSEITGGQLDTIDGQLYIHYKGSEPSISDILNAK